MAADVFTVALGTLLGAAVTCSVGVAALRRRPDPLAVPLALLLVAVAVWAASVALGLLPIGVPPLVAEQVSFLGVVVVPAAWLVLMVRYAGYGHRLSRRVYALLAVEPALVLLAVATSPATALVWRSVDVGHVGSVAVLVTAVGPVWWLNLAYSYVVVIGGVAFLFDVLVRSSPLYRKQASLLLVAVAVPLSTNAASVFLVGPGPAMDFTGASFLVTGVTFALALFHFDLLDLRPVARDVLVEDLADGMVVVDDDGQVVDFNATAADVLGPDLDVGAAADVALLAGDGAEDVVSATVDGRRRHYEAESRALTDVRDHVTGRVVYFREVTEIAEREQRISVLNRVLRHNVRNDVGLVAGYVDEMERRLPDDDRHLARSAREAIDELLELSEKARSLERTLATTPHQRVVDVDAVVHEVATGLRETYPFARVDTDVVAARAVVAGDPFETAIWNLAENAVVHNDREAPRVELAVAASRDAVTITVSDDGPGVPDVETRVLDDGFETPLVHGSGLGLWLVHWTAELSGGRLEFAARDPRGTRVTLTLDRAE